MIKLIKSFWQVHHKESRLLNNLTHGRNAGLLGGALSSVTLYFAFAYGNLEKTFGGWEYGWLVAVVLGVGFTLGVAWLVDAANADNLPEAFDLILGRKSFRNEKGKRDARKILFAVLTFVFCISCIVFSALIDWYGRGETAKTIVPEPVVQDEVRMMQELNEKRQAAIAPIEAEIVRVRAEIARAEKEVDRLYKSWINITKKGEDKWGWYAKQITKKKAEATGDLKKQLATLRKQKSDIYNQESATAATTLASVQQDNALKKEIYLESLSFTKRASGGAGVFFGFMALFCQLLLSLRNTAQQEVPEYQITHYSGTKKAQAPTGAPSAQPDMIPVKNDASEREVDYLRQLLAAQQGTVEKLSKELSKLSKELSKDKDKTVERQTVDKTVETVESLSDNGSGKTVERQTVDKTVEIVAVDCKNLIDRTMKQWTRSFTSDRESTRDTNRQKAQEGIAQLEALGYTVSKEGMKLSITKS